MMRQVSSFCWRASNDMTDAVLEDLLPDLDQDINELHDVAGMSHVSNMWSG